MAELNGDGGLYFFGWNCWRFGVGILVFFFFFFLTEMAIEMFCGSWFLFGVLGIEIRL